MSSKLGTQRNEARNRISKEAVQAASLVIARFRKTLDATLGLPDWQEAVRTALASLQLPGQRQGISFMQAVLSLPLESKRDLVAAVLERACGPLQRRSARALAQAWALQDPTRGRADLSRSQWYDLRRGISLRLASRYRSYKNAQSSLYENYEYITRQAGREICRDAGRIEDCVQEGALGLLQAIDRIEPGKPFASYAFQWTRRRIRNFLMKNSLPISAPVNLISKVSQSDSSRDDSPYDPKSLALALNCLQQPHLEYVDDAVHSAKSPAEFETEILSPIAAAARADLIELIDKALAQLSSKQREVLAMRFGVLNQDVVDTLQDIARVTGISRQQVARREKRALSKLEGLFSPFLNELA